MNIAMQDSMQGTDEKAREAKNVEARLDYKSWACVPLMADDLSISKPET